MPEVDTVFEIGGQDSKYISIQNGEVVDFQMNKICAAGTGSFVEEQAARMGIPLAEFGPLALSSEHPASLGERCTVFIETAIASASAEGISRADIAAGLCHSIVQNYLHKVVGSKPVGQHIVLQGGVDYNPGIVAAFQAPMAAGSGSARCSPSAVRMARLCWHRKLWATHPADLWDLTALHKPQTTAAVRRFRRILTSTGRRTNCFWRAIPANATRVKRP